MVGWHHLINGHEFENALGVGAVQFSTIPETEWFIYQTLLFLSAVSESA